MENIEYKVADINLAEWGNKEISIAEKEMPGLMALREEYINIKPIIYKHSDFYKIKDPRATKIKKRFKY